MRIRRNRGKSIQAYNILHSSHRSRYEGRNAESCLLMGNPHKSTSEMPDRWQAFVRPFRCTLALWACRPCFSESTNMVVPCSWASPIFPSTPIHYYITAVKVWNTTRQFAHSSASIKSEAEFLLHICVNGNANRHFFLTCRQSFRSGGKGKDTDFGSPSSGRRRFIKNLHTPQGR